MCTRMMISDYVLAGTILYILETVTGVHECYDLKEPNAFDMSSTIRRTSAIQKLVTLSETLTPKNLVTNDNVALPSTP
jgi:hypothetical protein